MSKFKRFIYKKAQRILLIVGSICVQNGALAQFLPFQGYLSDSEGAAIADGARIVQFKIYDAPVSGKAVWAGEVHKLSVNRGLVNAILGSKVSFDDLDFSGVNYLEMTVDADGDESITPADPPLLPRQVILPSVFATESANSRLLEGFALKDIFDETPENRPEKGLISGSRVLEGTVSGKEIGNRVIEARHLAEEITKLITPTGMIAPYMGPSLNPEGEKQSPPDGWLFCDGDLIPEGKKYSDLRSLLGKNTTPDLRGMFLRGLNNGRTDEFADPEGSDRILGDEQPELVGPHEHRLMTPMALSVHLSPGSNGVAAIRERDLQSNGTILQLGNTELKDGFVETRPDNVSVNFIIKY